MTENAAVIGRKLDEAKANVTHIRDDAKSTLDKLNAQKDVPKQTTRSARNATTETLGTADGVLKALARLKGEITRTDEPTSAQQAAWSKKIADLVTAATKQQKSAQATLQTLEDDLQETTVIATTAQLTAEQAQATAEETADDLFEYKKSMKGVLDLQRDVNVSTVSALTSHSVRLSNLESLTKTSWVGVVVGVVLGIIAGLIVRSLWAGHDWTVHTTAQGKQPVTFTPPAGQPWVAWMMAFATFVVVLGLVLLVSSFISKRHTVTEQREERDIAVPQASVPVQDHQGVDVFDDSDRPTNESTPTRALPVTDERTAGAEQASA